MKRIRAALGTLLVVFAIGGIQACADSPTAPADDSTECYWVDGMLLCSPN